MNADWLIPVLTGVLLAVVSFGLGLVTTAWTTRRQRNEELRRRRLDVFSEFCASAIEYRRAQLHRWHVGRRLGSPDDVEDRAPEAAEDVRSHRAAAWARYYEVAMISADPAIVDSAHTVLLTTKSMKWATSEDELNHRSEQVHDLVAAFARVVAPSVQARKQAEAAPGLR
jgi:hypothetical protein